jgi:hypothetical protein
MGTLLKKQSLSLRCTERVGLTSLFSCRGVSHTWDTLLKKQTLTLT